MAEAACPTCTLQGRLTATNYLQNVLSNGGFKLVLVGAVGFFMVVARLVYAFKLWCHFRGQRIAPRGVNDNLLRAAKKDDDGPRAAAKDDADAPTGTAALGYAYSFKAALSVDDNKALSVAMSGYMFGAGIITWATISDLNPADGWLNVGLVFAWQAIGVVLLEITRVITDKIIVPAVSLPHEVVQRRNLAAGIVEACSYIGSGQVISASLSGPANSWAVDIASVFMWFAIGQISFIGFAHMKRCSNGWSFREEIGEGNTAAAVVFGLSKITIGLFLANAIQKSDAILTFAVWFTAGTFVLISLSFVVDRLIIPGSKLDHEIRTDRNWGAAMVVGGMVMGVTVMLNTFLPDTCDNTT